MDQIRTRPRRKQFGCQRLAAVAGVLSVPNRRDDYRRYPEADQDPAPAVIHHSSTVRMTRAGKCRCMLADAVPPNVVEVHAGVQQMTALEEVVFPRHAAVAVPHTAGMTRSVWIVRIGRPSAIASAFATTWIRPGRTGSTACSSCRKMPGRRHSPAPLRTTRHYSDSSRGSASSARRCLWSSATPTVRDRKGSTQPSRGCIRWCAGVCAWLRARLVRRGLRPRRQCPGVRPERGAYSRGRAVY
jgi:hypothetical protein